MSTYFPTKLADIYDAPEQITRRIVGDAPLVDQVTDLGNQLRARILAANQNEDLSEIGRVNEITRLRSEFEANANDLLARVERRLSSVAEELDADAKPPAYIGPSRERAEAVRAAVLTEANLLMGGPWEAIEAAFERDLADHGERSPEVHAWARVLVPLAQKSGVKGGALVQVQERVDRIQAGLLTTRNQKAAALLPGVDKARVDLAAARVRMQYFATSRH